MTFDPADFYDAELRSHNRHLRAAARIGKQDRVLDIGCGAGQTSREAACAAVEGDVLGVDTSSEMLDVARRRGADAGLRNLAFEQADAQVHAFPPARFDLCISRFGVMFFTNPAAAFANIARAVRPGGRIIWMVWQEQARNPWAGAVRQAVTGQTTDNAEAAAAFSLGDSAVATELLRAAGFVSIGFADVHEPVFYGADVEAALRAVTGLYCAKDVLAGSDAAGALRRLRDLLDANASPAGVLFDSRAWIISAERAT